MRTMTIKTETTRRTVVVGGLGTVLSFFGPTKGSIAAQATPSAASPASGYAAIRIHTLNAAELVPEIDKLVVSQFVPQVQRLPSYLGYILADSTDQPKSNFTVSWFETMASAVASTKASAAWVAGLDPKFQHDRPITLDGSVMIAAAAAGTGTPSPVAALAPAGYVAIRRYRAAPGTDQASLAPKVRAGFVPILQSVPGFRGYLWMPLADGRVSVSLFDTKASADESTAKAADWVAKNTAVYTAGSPDVYNGKVVFIDVPRFGLGAH